MAKNDSDKESNKTGKSDNTGNIRGSEEDLKEEKAGRRDDAAEVYFDAARDRGLGR